MTDYDNVLVEIDGAVGTIMLNRPEELNALSQGLLEDLQNALREFNPGDAVRVVRIKAAGRTFSAGYDLTPGRRGPAATTPDRGTQAWELGESRIARDREGLRQTVDRWLWMWSFRNPIVAQVHGHCLAGGGELAGACDIIFAAEDARFGHPASRALGIPTHARPVAREDWHDQDERTAVYGGHDRRARGGADRNGQPRGPG